MKQTIEEAAEMYYLETEYRTPSSKKHFIAGAKSEAAKEFHTQGMYSKDDMIAFAVFYYSHQGKGDEYWGRDLFKVWYEKYKEKENGST